MPIVKRLFPLMIALVLAACAGPSARNREAPLIAEATERFRSGDYSGASQIYQRLAEQSDDGDYYRLLAADAELRAGNDRAAQALLGAIETDELMEGDRQRYALLRARLDLNQGKASEAMARLDGIDYQKLTSPLRAHYHTLRASAYNQLGNMLESARERIYYAQYTNNPEAIQRNNEAIYDSLNRLPEKVLTDLQPGTPGTLGGWMALVVAMRSPEPARPQAVKAWRANYPGHPANGSFVDGLMGPKARAVEVTPLKSAEAAPVTPPPAATPVQAATPSFTEPAPAPANATAAPPAAGGFIGVMLPLTGPYAQAAQAMRAGLTAAWNADTNPGKFELRYVDTQSQDVATLYRQLAGEGARFVIGPLLKEEVTALGKAGEFPVPVLALNQSPDVSRENFYQFALTPEQEVEQASGLAWFDGRQNALVLAPATAFGQRMINHFTAYWKNLGGRIAAVRTYKPGEADYSGTARQLLAGSSGGDAATATSASDFIFLIADSRDGRLLNPHIENQKPEGIPVYATSLIFNGNPDTPQNQDLSGVIFCDSPWLFSSNTGPLSRQSMQAEAQQTPELYLRLLPMGMDAYRLIPELNLLKNSSINRFSGETGVLTVQAGNRILRQLYCAQFEGNIPQPRGIAPMLQPARTQGMP